MSTTSGRWTKLYGSLIDGSAMALSRDARLLGIEAETWSDNTETDGFIPRNALRRITDADDPLDELTDALVAAERWAETDGGWEIVGFLDRHDTADKRATGRAISNSRLSGWRSHRDGQHNADGPKACPACNAVRNGVHEQNSAVGNAVRNGVRNATRSEAKRQRSEASGLVGSASPSAGAPGSASPTGWDGPTGAIIFDDNDEYERRFNKVFDEREAVADIYGGADFSLCAVCGVVEIGTDLEDRSTKWVLLEEPDNAVSAHAACIDGDSRFVPS